MHTLLSEILVFFHNYEFLYYIIEQNGLILRILRIMLKSFISMLVYLGFTFSAVVKALALQNILRVRNVRVEIFLAWFGLKKEIIWCKRKLNFMHRRLILGVL